MATNRQECSDIISFLRINNIDERLSYRYILSELRDIAQTLIKQDTDNRRIFKFPELWRPLPCGVEMEEVPLIECGIDLVDTRTIMRSKEKLPKSYETNYGPLMRVSNIDNSVNFFSTTAEAYTDFQNRRYKNQRQLYFFIVDDYLYIPNAYVEIVRVTGFWKDDDYLQYGHCKKSQNCIKPLDMEFNCPSYLRDPVKRTLKQQLLQTFGRTVDEKPNLNSNEKN